MASNNNPDVNTTEYVSDSPEPNFVFEPTSFRLEDGNISVSIPDSEGIGPFSAALRAVSARDFEAGLSGDERNASRAEFIQEIISLNQEAFDERNAARVEDGLPPVGAGREDFELSRIEPLILPAIYQGVSIEDALFINDTLDGPPVTIEGVSFNNLTGAFTTALQDRDGLVQGNANTIQAFLNETIQLTREATGDNSINLITIRDAEPIVFPASFDGINLTTLDVVQNATVREFDLSVDGNVQPTLPNTVVGTTEVIEHVAIVDLSSDLIAALQEQGLSEEAAGLSTERYLDQIRELNPGLGSGLVEGIPDVLTGLVIPAEFEGVDITQLPSTIGRLGPVATEQSVDAEIAQEMAEQAERAAEQAGNQEREPLTEEQQQAASDIYQRVSERLQDAPTTGTTFELSDDVLQEIKGIRDAVGQLASSHVENEAEDRVAGTAQDTDRDMGREGNIR